MKLPASGLVRLLRPHAGPYVGALVLVVVLGSLSALLMKGSILLLQPTWELLFPTVETAAEAVGAESVEGILADVRRGFSERLLGDPATWADDPDQRLRLLVLVGSVMAALALFAAGVQYTAGVLSSKVGLLMVVSLRMSLARHLMRLSLRYHAQRNFGDLLSRISNDVGRTLGVVQTALKDLVQEPLMALAALVMAFVVAPEATLFVVLGLPLLVVPVGILLRKVRRGSTTSLGRLGASLQVLTQMFRGMRTVKAYGAEERELERYEHANHDFVRATMRVVRATALSRAWTILYTHLGLAVVLVLVGWLVLTGRMVDDGGQLLTFFLLISHVYTHVKKTTRCLASVAEAGGACERLQALLDEKPDLVEASDAIELEGLGSGLRLERVGFQYEDDDDFAIQDVDLEVRPGETLALVGPSGSGKSTLLDLVARFVDPGEGRITVDGVDLRRVSLASWSRTYALVTQSPFLFHTTIGENLRYGRPDATDAEVEAAARAANIHDFVVALPNGYDTDVADAGTRLSGGQRQRITIARALLRNPELLLLDEATSALDTESERVVQAALDRVMEGRTTIVIAHRLSTIRNADRIAVLDEGRLVELGTHDELLSRGGTYARLHEAQFAESRRA